MTQRRFPIAMGMFVVLGILVWTTMQPARIGIAGRELDIRIVVSVLLGLLAFKTVLHWQAERIRAGNGRRQVREPM
jgi:hypothetical protein